MKLGFTGTRYGMTDRQKQSFQILVSVIENLEFHHGSCQGADVEAAEMVHANPHSIIVCHPGPYSDPHQVLLGYENEIRLSKGHFARNRDIVNETDELVATPREFCHQNRGGTWYTVDYAVKQGKPVRIIWPDGEMESWPRVSECAKP